MSKKHAVRFIDDGSRSQVECMCGWNSYTGTPMAVMAEYIDHRMDTMPLPVLTYKESEDD